MGGSLPERTFGRHRPTVFSDAHHRERAPVADRLPDVTTGERSSDEEYRAWLRTIGSARRPSRVGTAALIDDAARARAASTIVTGTPVGLARPLGSPGVEVDVHFVDGPVAMGGDRIERARAVQDGAESEFARGERKLSPICRSVRPWIRGHQCGAPGTHAVSRSAASTTGPSTHSRT